MKPLFLLLFVSMARGRLSYNRTFYVLWDWNDIKNIFKTEGRLSYSHTFYMFWHKGIT